VVQTALQAASRTIYAFSRDHGGFKISVFDSSCLSTAKEIVLMKDIGIY